MIVFADEYKIGFAFECQHFWNAVNLQAYPAFRDGIVRPGERFVSETQYEFSAESTATV